MKKYSTVDTFIVHGDIETTLNRVANHFHSMGLKPRRTDRTIQVHVGSDLMFRLFGAAIPIGSRNLPIGLEVDVTSELGRTIVKSFAYDRLGWYANDTLAWGGEKIVEDKMAALLRSVRTALSDQDSL